MKIIFPFHYNGFDSIQEDDNKEADKVGDKMFYTILYLENSDKSRFAIIKKHVENYYVLNKAEYPTTVISVQSILLKYQHNYNSNRNSQHNGVSNQLMFVQNGKNGDEKGNGK